MSKTVDVRIPEEVRDSLLELIPGVSWKERFEILMEVYKSSCNGGGIVEVPYSGISREEVLGMIKDNNRGIRAYVDKVVSSLVQD